VSESVVGEVQYEAVQAASSAQGSECMWGRDVSWGWGSIAWRWDRARARRVKVEVLLYWDGHMPKRDRDPLLWKKALSQ
jgi:hypothetical protein